MIYGDTDALNAALAIEETRYVAVLFHVAYSVLVVLVLVNIVLAIIVDSFERANENRHRAKDILTDLATLGTDLRLKLEGQTYSPNDAEAKADALLDAAKPPPGEKERAAPSADRAPATPRSLP